MYALKDCKKKFGCGLKGEKNSERMLKKNEDYHDSEERRDAFL